MTRRHPKTPTRADLDTWLQGIKAGRYVGQSLADMQEWVAVYTPIVEGYEETNALAKTIWALSVAAQEVPAASVAIKARIGELTVERQEKLKATGKLLKAARGMEP